MRAQPLRQHPLDRLLGGRELDEVEAAPERRVDKRNRAVGGVHRADHEQVRRQGELLLGPILQAHALLPVLEQEQELPEDLRDVAAVDLVDDQDVRTRRIGRRVSSDLAQRTVGAVIAHPVCTVVLDGTEAADEVLVAVGGVELNDPERTAVAGDLLRERERDKRLAGPGRPVEDDLALLLEQLKRILKPVTR